MLPLKMIIYNFSTCKDVKAKGKNIQIWKNIQFKICYYRIANMVFDFACLT